MSTDLEHDSKPDVADNGAPRAPQNGATPPAARAAAHIPRRPGADDYDTLLWRLCARQPDALGATFLLGIVGCGRQSGVSTLATNLAIRAADHGLGPVLLVDANVAHPHLHRLWKLKPSTGLADLLAGHDELEACVQTTPIAGLQLLPFGNPTRLDHARIDPVRFEGVVKQMREQFSPVICDLPEAREMSHALLLAGALDGALVVVRSQRVGRHAAQQAVNRLASDGVHVIGAVVTDHRRYLPNWLDARL